MFIKLNSFYVSSLMMHYMVQNILDIGTYLINSLLKIKNIIILTKNTLCTNSIFVKKKKVHPFIYCIHSFLNKLLYFFITTIIPKFFMECPFKEMTTVFEISKKYNLFGFIIKIITNVLYYWTIEMTTIYIFFLCSSLYCINLSSCVINLHSFMEVTIN